MLPGADFATEQTQRACHQLSVLLRSFRRVVASGRGAEQGEQGRRVATEQDSFAARRKAQPVETGCLGNRDAGVVCDQDGLGCAHGSLISNSIRARGL